MKNQRALSRLSSWLKSHKREHLKLLVFEESIERLELIDCTLRQSDEWMSEWKAKNPSLAPWLSAPDESNRNAVVKLCLSTKDSHALTERNKCRSKLREIEGLSSTIVRVEESILSEHWKRLWGIPNPQPSGSEFPSAFVRRLKVLGKWIEVFGYPSRLERLVTRINLWLALGDDCHDYKAPIHKSEGHMVEGCFTDEYRDKVYVIGCLAELLLKTKSSDESELLSIVESNRNLYFTNLDDLRWEYLQNHEKPVEPELKPTDAWCGVCLASFTWDGQLPCRCPKCEGEKRDRDNVTVSKSYDVNPIQEALRAVIDGGFAGVMRVAQSVPSRQQVSETMRNMLAANSKLYWWTADDWVRKLNCSKKTILGNKAKGIPQCDAWKEIMAWRESNKRVRFPEKL